MSEMTIKNKLIWAAVGGLAVMGTGFLIWSLTRADDPPILVGDGSMVIESYVPLETYSPTPDQHMITHPKANKKIHKIKHKGNEIADCAGKGNCTVTATWTNGFTIEVSDTGGNGATITSKDAAFNTGWEKHTYTWIYRFATSIPLVDIKATSDQINWTPICSGGSCKAEIEYK